MRSSAVAHCFSSFAAQSSSLCRSESDNLWPIALYDRLRTASVSTTKILCVLWIVERGNFRHHQPSRRFVAACRCTRAGFRRPICAGRLALLSEGVYRWTTPSLRQLVRGDARFWLVVICLWLFGLLIPFLAFRHQFLLLLGPPNATGPMMTISPCSFRRRLTILRLSS